MSDIVHATIVQVVIPLVLCVIAVRIVRLVSGFTMTLLQLALLVLLGSVLLQYAIDQGAQDTYARLLDSARSLLGVSRWTAQLSRALDALFGPTSATKSDAEPVYASAATDADWLTKLMWR
jgi:hypothetical protein